jgi:hypothetical protein
MHKLQMAFNVVPCFMDTFDQLSCPLSFFEQVFRSQDYNAIMFCLKQVCINHRYFEKLDHLFMQFIEISNISVCSFLIRLM